jgi:hypothetical protein
LYIENKNVHFDIENKNHNTDKKQKSLNTNKILVEDNTESEQIASFILEKNMI